jgi:hypothetical protein
VRTRATILALLSAAVLGAFYWYWEVKSAPVRAQAKEDAKRVFPELQAAGTGEVLLRHDAQPEVLLRRIDGRWRLLKPVQAAADESTVEALLQSLKDTKREEVVAASGANLHDFGLDQPSGAVTFKALSGEAKPQVLFFGMDSPAGDKAYGLVDGKPEVFLMAISNKTAILKDAVELRDKKLLAFDPDQVVSIQWPGFELSRNKEGRWQVGKEPAKPEAVNEWLAQLKGLSAEKLVEEKAAGTGKYGLGSTFTVRLQNQAAPLSLRFATDKAKLFAQVIGLPQVWSLRPSVKALLEKNGRTLMDLNAFDLNGMDVAKFTLARGADTLTAVKKDGAWAWEPAPEKGGREFNFDDFLNKIGGAELLQRLPDADKPAKPAMTLVFYTTNGTVLETITVGGKRGRGTVAASSAKHQVGVVADNLFQGFPPPKAP